MSGHMLFMFQNGLGTLDNKLLSEVYNWYNADKTVAKIRNNISPVAFPQGMKVTNGNGLFRIKGRVIDDVLENAKRVLDYKWMFGFCPYVIFRDSRTGEWRFSVPEFGSGRFMLKFDSTNYTTSVHFVPDNEFLIGGSAKAMNLSETVPGTISRSFEVYCWDGMSPNHKTKALKSPMWPVFIEYLKVFEFEQYALNAAFQSSRPEIFIRNSSAKMLSDEKFKEIKLDSDLLQMSERESDERTTFDYYATKRAEVSFQNTMTYQRGPETRKIFSTENAALDEKVKRNLTKGDVTVLPYGTEVQSGPSASVHSLEDNKKEALEQDILQILGIPMSIIKGKGGPATRYNSVQVATEIEKEQFNKAIARMRNDLLVFLKQIIALIQTVQTKNVLDEVFAYSQRAVQDRSNTLLANVSSGNLDIKDYISLVTTIEDSLKGMKVYLDELQKLDSLRIDFPLENDLRMLGLDEVIKLQQNRFITPLESGWLARASSGLLGLNRLVREGNQEIPKEVVRMLEIAQDRDKRELLQPIENAKPSNSAKSKKPNEKKRKGEQTSGNKEKPKSEKKQKTQ